jgi:5'(3')-deoxyribonucleotidase
MLIGVDVDGVVADFVGPVLRHVALRTGRQLTDSDIARFDMAGALGADAWESVKRELLSPPGFALGLEPYPGAVQGVRALREMGRVVFVTTPFTGSPTWSFERTEWLMKRLDASRSDIAHLVDKTLFAGDILVDDAPNQLEAWVRSGRAAVRMARPWNEGAPGEAAADWPGVVSIVRSHASARP